MRVVITEDKRFRIIGVDPSTTNMGVAVIDIDFISPNPFSLVYVNSLRGEHLSYDIPINYDDRDATRRSYGLARAYKELLSIYQPNAAICEDNFLGPSPDTFKRLVETVGMLRMATHEYGNGLYLFNVLPNLAKDLVGANFKGTQKEHVLQGLKLYPRLKLNGFDLDTVDDHAIDAIIIAVYLAEMVAKDHGILYMPDWRPTSLAPPKVEKVRIKRGQRRSKRKRGRS